MKNVGKKIVNTAKKVVKTVINTVKKVARTVTNAVKRTAKTVINAVTHTKTYQSVKNRVTSSGTYQKIVSKGSNFIRNVGSGLQKAGKTYTSFQSYVAERRAEIRAEVIRQMCTTADRISDQLGKVDWKKVGIAVVATGAAIGVGVLTGGVGIAAVGALGLTEGTLGAAIVGGAVTGAIGGATYSGVSSGLSGNSLKQVAKDTLTGGMIGAVAGGAMGGLAHGVGKIISGVGSEQFYPEDVIQYEKLKSQYAADEIYNADRIGSALKSDPSHRAASYLSKEQLASGRTYSFTGGDGKSYTLLQTRGQLDGADGIFEYITNDMGQVTHQRFIKNGIYTGTPNQVVPKGGY